MRKTLAILSVVAFLSLTGHSESAPLFGGRMRFQHGPISIPIPAFLPYFPGGTVVIPGNTGTANQPAASGAIVNADIHRATVDAGTKITQHLSEVDKQLPSLNRPAAKETDSKKMPKGKDD